MAKEGLTIPKLFRFIKEREQWALCIGAGTSKGLIPDWYGLIIELIKELDLPQIDIKYYLEKGYSLDAIIQAVKEMSGGMEDHEFVEKLSDIIYSPIKERIKDNNDWVAFETVHDWTIGFASIVTNDHEQRWERFGKIKSQVFKDTTAYGLAEILAQGFIKGIKPSSILTFNGEACFLALLNSFLFDYKKSIPNEFERVINCISDRQSTKIPCYHCHGIIPIKGVKYHKGYKADDKLVFSEDSYLQLANSNFSWQSSSFINTCLHNRVIFVGVSLTDSNMRRWLSWVHGAKLREMALNDMPTDNPTEHYWINLNPGDKNLQLWYENLVSILGVRIIWIDDWSEVATAIGILLGITSRQNTKAIAKQKKHNTKKNTTQRTKLSSKRPSKK